MTTNPLVTLAPLGQSVWLDYFHRADIVETGWGIVAPVLDTWQTGVTPVSEYAAGSWGPTDADALLLRDGRAWHDPLT